MRELADWLLGKGMDEYRKEIRERNVQVTDTFLLFGMILSMMVLDVQVFVRREAIVYTNVIMFIYFFALIFVRRIAAGRLIHNGTAMLYCIQIPMVIFSILMGTVWDSGREAFTIMVILASFPLCILGRPYRIVLYIVLGAAGFLLIDGFVKDPEIFRTDLNHIISSTLVSLGASMFVLNDRLESIRNYTIVRHRSETDALTGILNRSTAQNTIQDELDRGSTGVCIMCDLDDFKQINDKWGHLAGDDILRRTAETLKKVFPDGIVCRYGGDEFVIYLPGVTEEGPVRESLAEANRILADQPVWKRLGVKIRISTGCVIHDDTCTSVFPLFSTADQALYQVKRTDKGGIGFLSLSEEEKKK